MVLRGEEGDKARALWELLSKRSSPEVFWALEGRLVEMERGGGELGEYASAGLELLAEEIRRRGL